MSDLNELLDTFQKRLKSRLVSSILVSFAVVNWKVIYFLCFSDVQIVERFAYFDDNTNTASLLIKPLLFGLAAVGLVPLFSSAATWVISFPETWTRNAGHHAKFREENYRQKLESDFEDKITHERIRLEELELNCSQIEKALRDKQVDYDDLSDLRDELEVQLGIIREEIQIANSENPSSEDYSELPPNWKTNIVVLSMLSDVQKGVLRDLDSARSSIPAKQLLSMGAKGQLTMRKLPNREIKEHVEQGLTGLYEKSLVQNISKPDSSNEIELTPRGRAIVELMRK